MSNNDGKMGGKRSRLLVIDDDLLQRGIIRRVGAQVGYDTLAAASVEEAEQCLATNSFDCVALDLSLGGRDGIEILHALANGEVCAPVIVISGGERRMLAAAINVAESLGLTIAASLAKPVRLDELRQTMARFVEGVIQVPPEAESESSWVEAGQIRDAIANGEIELEFVPKMALGNGHVYGCNAIAHWQSGRAGYVEAGVLQAMAKRCGMAAALGEMMVRETLEQGPRIAQARPDFSISVDVTDFLLGDPDAAAKIDAMLQKMEPGLGFLTLAVRHEALAQSGDRILDALVRVRIRKVGIALQDFGCAPFSISALARKPFGEAIIDSHFIGAMVSRPEARRIVRAAIAVANELGMLSVAAGVDQPGMVPLLQDAGCWAAMGLAIATPVSLSQMPKTVDLWKRGPESQTGESLKTATR